MGIEKPLGYGWGKDFGWTWWHVPSISAFRRLKQEDPKFQAT